MLEESDKLVVKCSKQDIGFSLKRANREMERSETCKVSVA